MFPLSLQPIISNPMRPRRLRGVWFSRLLRHPAMRWSGSILSPGTHTGFSSASLCRDHSVQPLPNHFGSCYQYQLVQFITWKDVLTKWPSLCLVGPGNATDSTCFINYCYRCLFVTYYIFQLVSSCTFWLKTTVFYLADGMWIDSFVTAPHKFSFLLIYWHRFTFGATVRNIFQYWNIAFAFRQQHCSCFAPYDII